MLVEEWIKKPLSLLVPPGTAGVLIGSEESIKRLMGGEFKC